MWVLATFLFNGVLDSTLLAADSSTDDARLWPQWRGPLANGLAPTGDPPVEWSESKNVRWKVEIPGNGHSTPIVWGDLVFLQTAVPKETSNAPAKKDDEATKPGSAASNDNSAKVDPPRDGPGGERPPRGEGRGPRGNRPPPSDAYRFVVMALDRRTGKPVWEKTVREEVPHEGSHEDGSLAPASPLTDGKHLFAYFGSRGLYCMTMTGDVVWEKDLGDMKTRNGFGEGSSPALHGDTIVVNWDHESGSFVVALDKRTGAEKWRRDRDEATSWTTPFFLPDQAPPQVLITGTKRVRSYNLADGSIVWECGGLGSNCVPMPVLGKDLLFVMSGHRDPALLAIRYPKATGDLTGSDAVAWKLDKGTPYVPSPLLYGDALYFIQKNSEILSCHDPASGKQHFTERLEEINGVYASPIGAADRVYVTGRNGTTYVLRRGTEFKVLAVNKLDDEFSASAAIADRELFLRGAKRLYCVAAD